MLKKEILFLSILAVLCLPAFAQSDRIPVRPGFYYSKIAVINKLSKLIKLEPILDSIKKSSAPAHHKSLSVTSISIYMDTLQLDSISFDRVCISMNNTLNGENSSYKIRLPRTFKISTRFLNINLAEHARLYALPDTHDALLYEREETDELDDLLIIDRFIDKKQRLWIKYSFTVSRQEPLDEENEKGWSGKKKIVGWSPAGTLSLNYCIYQ